MRDETCVVLDSPELCVDISGVVGLFAFWFAQPIFTAEISRVPLYSHGAPSSIGPSIFLEPHIWSC